MLELFDMDIYFSLAQSSKTEVEQGQKLWTVRLSGTGKIGFEHVKNNHGFPTEMCQKAQEQMGTYLCNYWSQKNGSPIKICRILPQTQPEYFDNDLYSQLSLRKVEKKIYMDEAYNYFSTGHL